MRDIVLTTATILLLGTGMAHAQSGQGGHLAENPGPHQTTARVKIWLPVAQILNVVSHAADR